MNARVKRLDRALQGIDRQGPGAERGGEYPLARFLLININKKPGQPLDTLTTEFVKFIQSKDGQQVVVKDGYYPIPPEVIEETQATLAK